MARKASEAFQGFLDAIALPMLVVDRDRRLVFSNVSGQRLLKRGEVFRLDANDRLQLLSKNRAEIQKRIEGVEQNEVPSSMRLEEVEGAISLYITPFHPDMANSAKTDQDLFDARRLFAIFADAQDVSTVNPGLLGDTFDLTGREAEECAALLGGQSTAEIANQTGRSERTIRNQIQTAYQKVGVNALQGLNEAMSVSKVVGAMFNNADQHMFEMEPSANQATPPT